MVNDNLLAMERSSPFEWEKSLAIYGLRWCFFLTIYLVDGIPSPVMEIVGL